jgi:hypothetical protein
MTIFKKIFGKRKDEQLEKPNMDSLLNSSDTHSSIIELDNYICKVCAYGEQLEKLSHPQKLFFFNQQLEREVNSGGFNSYFYYSYADYAYETVDSLKSVGAEKFANILQQAIDLFPNSKVPMNLAERQTFVDQVPSEKWTELDNEFYAYPEDLNTLNLKFVREHREHF